MEAINMAKAREALEFIKLTSDDYEKYGTTKAGALDVIYEKACSALAEPARNCDVGTIEEQKRRFNKFCDSNADPFDIDNWQCGRQCPVYGKCKCEFDWLQMPYGEDAK